MVTCLASCGGNKTEVYKNSAAPVKDRIEDLLGRMTLEEKVGQMNQFVGLEHIKANSAVMTEEELKRFRASFDPDMMGFDGTEGADEEEETENGK